MIFYECPDQLICLLYIPYYGRLLLMFGFILSPKNYADFCFKPSGLFLIKFFFNDLQLQIIECIFLKNGDNYTKSPVAWYDTGVKY